MKENTCLICIDGWGISSGDSTGDAILNADTPIMDKFKVEYPYTTLEAHGLAVGLPDGLMGNSEVGHLNIGAGRIVYQVSDGGVHSHINHLICLLESAKSIGICDAYVHFFGDGRDTDPRSSDKYLEQLQKVSGEINYGKIATMTGRYYAMDRDKRWERIKIAVDDETDEFLKPIIVNEEGLIKDNDTLFFFNFRSDRMRQIVQTLGISPPPFEIEIPKNLHITTMTRYKTEFSFPVAFSSQIMDNILAEWLSKNKIPQCHVAETEKYAHVTFFFNGGVEKQFELECRHLIQSPKVATYDLKPEMSALEIAEKVVEEITCGKFPFIMCNLANPDMVGHTGIYEAAVKAVETTDKVIGLIYEACKKNNYILFVTSDHGNAEQMKGEDGNPHTAHTCNPVPFVMTSKNHSFTESAKGALCDVAPTILDVMGLEIPKEMTGTSLLKK
ncbi:10613_t:CDS:2 [Entrophospora sp. SA101]|nr:10613_t:CDS:2 [Entrophospora sp. SA101]